MGSGATATATPHTSSTPEPEKVFKCPTCARIFNKKANLKVHSRKHTGEKPYACSKPGCGRAFMWKSSVTFHEQNCPSAKRPSADPPIRHPVPKRPKSSLRASKSSPKSSSPPSAALPNSPVTTEDPFLRPSIHLRDQSSLNSHIPSVNPSSSALHQSQLPIRPGVTDVIPLSFAASPPPPQQLFANPVALVPTPSPPVQSPTPLESHHLPAPSTLLEKRLQSAGRPPIIPGSLPKHRYSLPTMEGPPGPKPPFFELMIPASPTPTAVPSANKPPAMFNPKVMPKMPIAMDLDDSDDEAPGKFIGAQESFMRTGNPFGGFAPPTRCSPLPISSPIVCPGISPMPLSPLAPFSPLPPDSPAHNAPNPIHPPVNQPAIRPNTSW